MSRTSEAGELDESEKEVFKAVKKDDIKLVQTLLKSTDKSVKDITGKNGNSICHVAAKYGKLNVLRKYGKILMGKKFINEVGDSWLHEAARYGQIEVAIFIIETFRESLKNEGNVNNRGENFVDGALFSVEINRDKKIEFIEELNRKNSIQEIFKIMFPKQETDGKSTGNNVRTMLHKIAAHGFSELVGFFDFEGLDRKDERGNTAFHVAAGCGQLETLQELVALFEDRSRRPGETVKLKDIINWGNSVGETCLHLAMKSLHSEMVKYLISKRADLALRDKTKNTPLHGLVAKAASDESNTAEFINMWQVVVDNVVFWWCKKHGLNTPNTTHPDFKIYKRDALYYLRSEIPNNDNLSVIQLAATRGLAKFVREMIWVENVFVEQSEKKGTAYITINVTNLMPHLKGGENIKYKKDKQWVFFSDLSKKQGQNANSNEEGRCGCLLNAILEMEHSNKANEIFKIEPMKQLVRDHWFVHQWWTVVMLLSHLLFMALYGSYSLSNIYTIYATNRTNADELQINQAYITWPIFLVVPDIILWVVLPILSLIQGKQGEQRKGAWIKYLKRLVIEDVSIDVKDTFNWPSVILSVFVLLTTLTMPLIFCFTTIVGLQLLNSNHDAYAYFTTVSIVVGWLLTFYWAGAFEPVYRFLKASRSIILKDVISFLFFYIFVLLAFSNAIYAIMTWVPSLMEQYDDVDDVIYELLLVGCGASSRMSSEDIANEYDRLGYNSLMFKILFTTYIFITLVGLLNLIIASMCDTYASFSRTDHEGYHQHSLIMSRRSSAGFFIGSELIQPLFIRYRIIDKFIKHDNKHDRGHEEKYNGHSVMEVPKERIEMKSVN